MPRAAAAQRGANKAGAALPDDVRRRVLDASVALIDRVGLAGLSMREVARAAGVSHQAPYHYFEDREAILAALAQEGFELLGERLGRVIAAEAPAVDRFVRCGEGYVEFALDHPALFRIMFRPDMVTMERFPETHDCGERCFAIVPKIVGEVIAEGLAPDPSAQALVILAWSLPHGLACLLLDGPLTKMLPESSTRAATTVMVREVMAAMRALMTRAAPAPRKTARRR